MDNIKESKEYQLAKDWERAVNDYGFNPKRFAAAIPEMHPTLQQSLYRLVKECIVVMADETRNYDDRNRASDCVRAGSTPRRVWPYSCLCRRSCLAGGR